MINLKVCVPDATENYVMNPSFRYATTGWTAVGAALTRTLDYARFNIASGKVVTTGAALYEGVYYRVTSLSGISDVITASIYVRGGSNGQKVRLRLQDDPTGFEWTSEVVELETARWKRISVTGRCTGSNDVRLKVETAAASAVAYTFYVDGAQIERKAYATSYCDGDQPGCRWNVVNHGSNSTRTADTREGGKWVALAGTCRPYNDIYVTIMGGFGMPPVENNIQPWSQSPGSFFQNQKIQDRVMTLNFTVKKENLRSTNPQSLRSIHELRQQLVDLFKTDVTLNDEAFWFEYSDTEGDKPLYIRMRYEAGLEGSWDVRNGWFNTFAVRMLAVDPLWMEDTQEVKVMEIKDWVANAVSDGWYRKEGQWSQLKNSAGTPIGTLVTDSVYSITEGPDGTIYIGGQFTSPANRIMKWDGTTLTELGVGGANDYVTDIRAAPDGTVYATGNFTVIGGVAANRIAKYTPSTNTWAALGAGLDDYGSTLCIAMDGTLFVGGAFSNAGGAAANHLARWNGAAWSVVGGGAGGGTAGNGYVHKIIRGNDSNTLYFCGQFISSTAGLTILRVAKIIISSNTIGSVGYGIGGGVVTVADFVGGLTLGLDGTLYACGNFSVSGAPSAESLKKVAMWSGGNLWKQVGDGFGPAGSTFGNVSDLFTGINGEIYAAGKMQYSGDVPITMAAKWTGGTWHPLEFPQRVSTEGLSSITEAKNGDLYLGGQLFAPYDYPKINTINNPGTTSCWPTLYIKGSGKFHYISNIKTGQEIFFDLTVLDGEEVFIDFAKGKIISTVRGDLAYTLIPGSEIRSVYLLPGENKLAVLMDYDVGVTMQIRWQPSDWSADAVVDVAAMV